jgi:hypothetical protein
MSSHARFMDLVSNGDVLMDEINDFVAEWHETETDESISEFLGMGQAEYDLWVEQPASLRLIVAAREDGLALHTAIEQYAELEPVAARGADSETAIVVMKWLRKTGRMPH